jgi:hypothetical protein
MATKKKPVVIPVDSCGACPFVDLESGDLCVASSLRPLGSLGAPPRWCPLRGAGVVVELAAHTPPPVKRQRRALGGGE